MPDVRTVVHRDIHFIDTTEDGHRIFIAKGVRGSQYHDLEGRGRSKQEAYDRLVGRKASIDENTEKAGVEIPLYCPGDEDPRCKGICTLTGRDKNGELVLGKGAEIMDPDCFR